MYPAIPYIANVLGHSVIYEEHKGNFAHARKVAEAELINAQRSGDLGSLADAWLARGLIHLLQGEPPRAINCFVKVQQLVPSDSNRCLRAISYSNLATYWRYNLFPDGSGANSAELQARWNGQAYAASQDSQREAAFRQANESNVKFESLLVHQFLGNLLPSRSFVQTSRHQATSAMTSQLLQLALQGIESFRKEAEKIAPTMLAYADLAAADLCHRAGNSQWAEQFLHRAFDIYQQNKDLSGAGTCRMIAGDWRAAPFSTPKVWNLAIQESSSSGSDLSWPLEAEEFGLAGTNLSDCRQMYDQAKEMFEIAGSPRALANIELRYGYLAMLEGNYESAINHAKQARDAFVSCGDRLGYWLAEAHRVLSRIGAGQYPEEGSVAEAMGRWGASDGSFSYALGLGLMFGRVGRHWLIRKGDYERSLACYRLAALLYKSLRATTNLAKSLVDQGTVYQALGERNTALTLYEQALDTSGGDTSAPSSLAPSWQVQRIMLANDVFQLYQEAKNPDGMERSVRRLEEFLIPLQGTSSVQTTEADSAAVEVFALSNLARSTIEQTTVMVPAYRALTARNRGDSVEANRLFTEAISAVQEINEDRRDLTEAIVFAHLKEYGKAVEAFHRYLAKGGANLGFIGTLASVMQGSGGEWGQQEVLRQVERTYEQAFTFFVRTKAYSEAKAYFDELIKLTNENWLTRDTRPWLTLSDCAEMYEGLKEWTTALEYYDQAIRELEARRNQLSRDELKTALVAGSGPQYLYFQATRAALTLAKQAGSNDNAKLYAARAFEYSERGKARALLDLMAGSATLAGSSAVESQTMRAWRQVNAQLTLWRGLLALERNKREMDQDRITDLIQYIAEQQDELDKLEGQLSQSNPNFYQAISIQTQVMSAEDVCAALPKDTALLQYSFLGDDFLAWAMTAEGIIEPHMAVVDAKALDRQIKGFHSACMEHQALDPLGSQLAEIFLSPFADVIERYTHLIVVPYGAAHVLPFHALPWKSEPVGASRVLSYLPSTSALQFVRSRDTIQPPDRILAVGSPKDMMYHHPLTDELVPTPDLPAAAAEATFVASLFPNGKALIGDQATEAAVRELLANYPLLHFATHGVLSEEAPLISAILLANGEALNVYELMGLQLNADLVVLSACRTALGEITGGDDVIGLTRGLLGTGAGAAIVSLWPVNDLSTSLLMGEFYRQLRDHKAAAEALHAAQNYLRKLEPPQIKAELERLRDAGYTRDTMRRGAPITSNDYSHPHFWAPFILIG